MKRIAKFWRAGLDDSEPWIVGVIFLLVVFGTLACVALIALLQN